MAPLTSPTSPPLQDGDLLAAIDLGSNSFHMVVARSMLGQLRVVDRLRETVRMADGLDGKGGLSAAARQRALDCLSRFGQRIRDIPAARVRALATNTVRQLREPQEFLAAAEAALGKPIEVVSGREEARLIYLGVAHAQPPKANQRRLVIDIGGGSTEFIIGRGFETLERESLQAGCIASTRRFFPGGKLSRKRWKEALTEIGAEFQQFAGLYRSLGWQEAIGSSGTNKAIGEICAAMKLTKGAVTAEALPQVRDKLLQADRIEDIDLPGLSSDRRPIIAGGVLVLEAAFEALELQRLMVSKAAMREGILFDMLGKLGLPEIILTIVTIITVVLVAIFFVTGADSASIVMGSLSENGAEEPSKWNVVFWGVATGAVARKTYDDAASARNARQAQVQAAKAAVAAAQLDLSYARVTAPIAGRVDRVLVTDSVDAAFAEIDALVADRGGSTGTNAEGCDAR